MSKKVLGVSVFLAVLATAGLASSQTQELMSVKTTLEHGGSTLRIEQNYDVMRPKASEVFDGLEGGIRGCGGDLKICGGQPEFVRELIAACGGLHKPIIRPKKGSQSDFIVSTNYSSTEVIGVNTERPLKIVREMVGPPREIIGSIILRCSQQGDGTGTPDINSIHDVEVCHGGDAGTCFNASTAQANNQAP